MGYHLVFKALLNRLLRSHEKKSMLENISIMKSLKTEMKKTY